MSWFLYRLIPPRPTFPVDMTEAEGEIMRRHAGYWSEQMERGRVAVFGPVADPAGAWGLGVVEAESGDEVRALGDADPAVTSSLASFEVCEMPGAVVAAAPRHTST
jgi:uncharacterized protein